MLKPNAKDLSILLGWMKQGNLQSLVGASFPFTELADAWRLNEKGGTLGKIGITYPES
jgi:NADPH:quinone reductase-like Zn-dependent oxidoreductase